MSQLDQRPVDTKVLQEAELANELYSQALKFTMTGWPDRNTQNVESKRKGEVTVKGGYLLWGRRVVTPGHAENVCSRSYAGHGDIV